MLCETTALPEIGVWPHLLEAKHLKSLRTSLWARHPRELRRFLARCRQIASAESRLEVEEAWEPVFSRTNDSSLLEGDEATLQRYLEGLHTFYDQDLVLQRLEDTPSYDLMRASVLNLRVRT